MRKKKLITKKDVALVLSLWFGFLALSFIVESFIIFLICWAFGLNFSFRMAFGIWLILMLMSSATNFQKSS